MTRDAGGTDPGRDPAAEPRRAPALRASARADLAGRTDRRAGAQPQHDRRAHRRSRPRPGWSREELPQGPRPGRTTLAGRPARVRGVRVRAGRSRSTGSSPRGSGSAARCSTGARRSAPPRRAVAGRGGRAAGRVRPGDAARGARRTPGTSAAARPSPAWFGRRTGWCASARTSAGSTSRCGEALGKVLGGDRPVPVRNNADLGALAEHVRGVAVGLRQHRLPDRRRRHRRRDHRRRPAGHRARRVRRRGRPHGGQPGRPAVRLRRARLLGDRDRRARAAAAAGRVAVAPAVDRPRRGPRGDRRGRPRRRPRPGAAAAGRRLAGVRRGQPGEHLQPGDGHLRRRLREIYIAAAAQVRSRLNRNGAAGLPRARAAAHPVAGRGRGAARRGGAGLRAAARRPAGRLVARSTHSGVLDVPGVRRGPRRGRGRRRPRPGRAATALRAAGSIRSLRPRHSPRRRCDGRRRASSAPSAGGMFFTRTGLEQATRWPVAVARAERLPRRAPGGWPTWGAASAPTAWRSRGPACRAWRWSPTRRRPRWRGRTCRGARAPAGRHRLTPLDGRPVHCGRRVLRPGPAHVRRPPGLLHRRPLPAVGVRASTSSRGCRSPCSSSRRDSRTTSSRPASRPSGCRWTATWWRRRSGRRRWPASPARDRVPRRRRRTR